MYATSSPLNINARYVDCNSKLNQSIVQDDAKLKAQSCSTECYKAHQSTHVEGAHPPPTQPVPNSLPPKPPPVPFADPPMSYGSIRDPPLTERSVLSLQSSPMLQRLYAQHPRLRNQLREIYEATSQSTDENPSSHHFSGNRSYRGRGRGKIRGRGHDREKGAPWSQQRGFKAGLHQMRKLKNFKGINGDGLREFSKLVTDMTEAKSAQTIGTGT